MEQIKGFYRKMDPIEKYFFSNKKIMEITNTIWSPFIIEPLMNCFGFKLIKRKPEKEWNGWQEVYIKK